MLLLLFSEWVNSARDDLVGTISVIVNLQK